MTTLASDNFNRADGGLGSNWTTTTGDSAPTIVSNAVRVSATATGNSAFYNAVTWPNDQWSEVVISACSGTGEVGAIVRAAPAANTYYYAAVQGTLGAGAAVNIHKFVAGTFSPMVNTTATVVANDVLRLEAEGTTIRLKINGSTVLSTTDGSISSGSAGVSPYVDSGADTQSILDSWQGGDFNTAAIVIAWIRA